MPRCLIITPFPLFIPKHGGQVRAASMIKAMRRAGWHTDSVGIYHESFFPSEEWGALDIVMNDQTVRDRALSDILFADLHVAQAAARDKNVISQLRRVLRRVAPDVIHMEHPWDWPVLMEALPPDSKAKIIYSSQNIEWRSRENFLGFGIQRADSAKWIDTTRTLEMQVARDADLVLAISDLEAAEIEAEAGRPVVYVPAVSDLADPEIEINGKFAQQASAEKIRYAALMGSAYWPNVEGFFDLFPQGLGFLTQDERIWVAGTIGRGLTEDIRYGDFQSINDSRFRAIGYIDDADRAAFLTPAACVLVPVRLGAGAKLKTADAVASGSPVIATPHSLEGYGPIVQDALGCGVYVADTPDEYRALVRQALREGLQGCSGAVRSKLSLKQMVATLGAEMQKLLDAPHLSRFQDAPPVQ
ncbi:glycosyltransferase [Caballeronia sp. LjRoot31]|uniref:glycosyltransferase n=1 Tax=Caballeronia sp. LjRoot31 TaxID=3342324 RepID=UPI003F507588